MKKFISFLFAITLLTSVFAQQKVDALAQYNNGRKAEGAGNKQEATQLYQSAVDACYAELKEKPNNIESYVVLTWALLRMEKYPETIAECNKALKIKPNEYRIVETLGEATFYNKQYAASMPYFEQYVNAMPSSAARYSTAYFFMGEIYRIQKKWEHADIAYSTAVRFSPRASLWWYRLGSVRESSGNKELAKAAYQQALSIRPNYPDAQAALQRL